MGTVCQSFITATATLFLILIAAHLQEVKSFSIFELNLVSFENREGRDFRGGCCSGRLGADGLCPPCPVYLRVCVKHYQVIVDPASPCTFHEFVTPLLEAANGTTEEDRGLQVLSDQDTTMMVNLNFTWPEEFSLIVEAWHPPDGKGSNKVLVSRFMAQRTLKVGLDWTPDKVSTNQSSVKVMYRVFCATNYYGPNCESLCKPRDDKFGHYTCRDDGQKLCKAGWTGSYCQKALCLPGCNHGNCEQPNECNCRPGWVGELCDTCTRYPGCQHGTCTEPWQCTCDEGWGGLFCDQDLNYCTNHKPCHNGGTCTNTGQGSYTCSCTDEFLGENCNILKNPCQKNPCRNDGVCQNQEAGQYTCECATGFYGPHCETTASICTKNPCENGGSCIRDPKGVICDCPPGFSGVLCEKKDLVSCKTGYCLNGGTCVELLSGPHCNCPQGLSGDHCETIVTCSSNVCKNGGSCRQHSSTGQFSCACPPGFSGWNCEVKTQDCASNPCANGGECRDSRHGYYCDCKPGFGGTDCSQRNTNHCSSSPCSNGALCRDTATGFSCQCLSGYHGIRCQHKEDNSTVDFSRQSSVASNVSHRVSSAEETQPLSGKQVALIASLSSILPILVILLCCVICCTLRRRQQLKQQRSVAQQLPKAKECDFDFEDEQLQNERNIMHMNNKQLNMPQKIVNTLDRLPAKVSNEAPPKVLNIEVSNKKVLDKSLVCPQRTLKKDNAYGSSISSHVTQDWSSSNSAGIYVIEDHFRSCPDVGPTLEVENILATEV